MSAPPPAAWHVDPHDPSRLRYWDGTQWTGHTAPLPPQLPATPTPDLQPKVQASLDAQPNFWQRRGFLGKVAIVAGTVLVGLAAVGAVLPEPDDGTLTATAPTSSERPESAPTTGAPSTTQTPATAPAEAAAPAPTSPPAAPAPASPALTVSRVVDGDTVEMSDGSTIRLIGIDTPERGECGYSEASEFLEALVAGQSVTLTPGARDDVDRYGRLLRYLDLGDGGDANLAMIEWGLAIARYDSRDGYGRHTREDTYVAADAASPGLCDVPAPVPTAAPAPPAPQPPTGNCDPSYPDVCIPPAPPDLNCGDITFRRFTVLPPDPHNFDGNKDGVGCEG